MLTLKQALVVLAAKPSFHPADATYGMKMARSTLLEAEWTPRMRTVIYDIIAKHKAELEAYGYSLSEVKKPPAPITPIVTSEVAKTVPVSAPSERRFVRMKCSGQYTVWSEYNQKLVDVIKQLPYPNRRWSKENKCWEISFENSDIRALAEFSNIVSQWGFTYGEDVKKDLERQSERAILDEQKRTDAFKASFATESHAELIIPNLGGTLRGFQKAGVLYAIEKKRCFIADEMGLGKTVQALALIEHENAFPAIIVTRAALRKNWVKETRVWLPKRKVTLDPEDMAYGVMEILVISYDGLVKWYSKLEEYDWRAIIGDESQCIKSNKAKRTQAMKDLAKVSHAPIRLCLTGTPCENMPYEFFPQITFLGQMDKLGGSRFAFEEYCGGRSDGAQKMDIFNAEMRKHFYIRRLKKDVLTELPPKQRVYVPLEIDNMKEYQQAEKDLASWLRGEVVKNPDRFDVADDQLIEDASVEAKISNMEGKVSQHEGLLKVNWLKQLAMRGLLESAKQWIEDFIESGQKLVVFCEHIEAQRQVYQLFKDVAVWTRNSAGAQAAVDAFQKDAKVRLIVCSLKADHAGHTLTAASNVCFLELGWTPTIHDQAEDRAHRMGQRDSVTAWYLIAAKTIYEKIIKLIDEKREVVHAATEGTKILPKQKSIMSDLIRQLTAA